MGLLKSVIVARPRSLGVAVVPALVGSGLALAGGGATAWKLWAACVPALILVQVGANFVAASVVDTRPGAQRLGTLCFVMALIFGWTVVKERGWPLLVLAIWGGVAVLTVPGGDIGLVQYTWGDTVVSLLTVVAITTGAKYIHQGGALVNRDALTAGAQVGLLSSQLLAIANLRDCKGDTDSNRIHSELPDRAMWTRLQICLQACAAYGLSWHWAVQGLWRAAIYPLATSPVAAGLVLHAVFSSPTSQRDQAKLQHQMGLLHLAFGILLATGLAMSPHSLG
ncbi:hypothetical protein WJX72_004935 [[Myrmecia] bisecta]|uniref:1,4-dihydroxy-2-naphthoate octaprenyltransferase n=1 Tax=[Myrmecia] bisecta TaxID=41462 RepID=A0AAW1QF00_9CHLO